MLLLTKQNFLGFDTPLVFIDPVDSNRNVASALVEEKFDLFVEMYEARENEDFQRVQEIRAELGFERGGRGRMMK